MILDLLGDFWHGGDGASEVQLLRAETRLQVRLPDDVRRLLRRSNGGYWYVGDRHVHVWDIQRIEGYNKAPPVRVPIPGLVGIAEDMVTGSCYALDYRPGIEVGVVQVPLPALDPLEPCGVTFSACLLCWHYEGIDQVFLDYMRRGSVPDVVELLRKLPVGHRRPGASPGEIDSAEAAFGVIFPDDYKRILRWADGFVCVAGVQYLCLLSVGELVQENRAAEIDKHMPGAIMIGSDAGDRCFALHYEAPRQLPRVISCDLGGLDLDEAELCGPSLEACLQKWSGIDRAALAGARTRLLRCLAARCSLVGSNAWSAR